MTVSDPDTDPDLQPPHRNTGAGRMRVIKPGLLEWIYIICNGFGFMANRLYPIEACLFRELFAVLPDAYRELFEKQLTYMAVYQRTAGWRMLAMFPMRHFWQGRGVDRFPVELRVPTDKEDVRLASFKFRVAEQGVENNAVFHVVNGRMFSIDFGEDYRPIRFAAELEIVKHKVNRSDFPSLETKP